MKKLLIVTALLAMLCSCAGTTTKVPETQPQEGSVPVASHTVPENPGSDSKNDEAPTTSGTTVPEAPVDPDTGMPNQSFVGVWSSDEAGTNQILISRITPVAVNFNTGVNGLFGFDATAMLSNDGIIFGDGVSPGYAGPEGLKGKLVFSEGSITVIYESFGTLPDAEFYPTEYTFTIKEENSDELISQYKENISN